MAKAVEGIMQEPRVFTDGDEQSWKFGQNNLLKSNNKKQRMKLRHQISNKKCQLPAHSLFSVINIGFSALHTVDYHMLSLDSTTRAEQHTTNRRSFYSLPQVVTLFCHWFLSNNTTYNVVQQPHMKPTHHLGFLQDPFQFHSVVATNQMFFVRLCYK